MFWVLLFLFVGTTALSALLQNHQGIKASGLGDFTAPTADATRVIPVIWGTVKLTGPNVIWYGDLRSKAIKQSSLFGLMPSQTIGHKYYLGMWLGCCHGPVDDILGLGFGTHPNDKAVAFNTKTLLGGDHYRVNVNQPNLYGGDKSEGGISGDFDFYLGHAVQAPNDYMTNKLGLLGIGGGVAYIPTITGAGNGTLSNVQVTVNTVLETITILFTGSTHFTVSGSVSGALGSGTTGNTFACSVVSFKVNVGSNPWVAGDRIQFNTAPPATSGAPAYPRLCHMVLRQMYLGTSNYIKNLSPIIKRTFAADVLGLGAGADINGDANPANILYECLTNTIWGRGKPPALINVASFTAAGARLVTDGMGMSVHLDTPAQLDTFMSDILSHIDGAIYTDPQTGLWTLKLARFDYDPTTLPVFDQTVIIGTPEFNRPSWEELSNQIYLTYLDRASGYIERNVMANESAGYATTGIIQEAALKMTGFSNATIAQFVAMRELKQHSYPLAQIRLKANRTAWTMRIGSVFKYTFPAHGVSNLVVRVTSINYGALEKGEIEIQAVEDIYNLGFAAYAPPNPSSWVNPSTAPQPPLAELAIEAPYQIVGDVRQVLVTAVRLDQTSTGMEVWSDSGAGYQKLTQFDGFCPSGVLLNDYLRTTAAQDTTGFVITGPVDMDDVTNTDAAGRTAGTILALVDGELMSVLTVTDNLDGTFTVAGVWRGVMDTVPADHFAGARVWFLTAGSINAAYSTAGLAADITSRPYKMLPYNTQGTVAIASVSPVTLTTVTRYSKPYPPGNVKVNALYWLSSATNDAALTLAHRNRVNQRTAGALVPQDDNNTAGVTEEGNYTIEVLVGGVVKQTQTAQTGTGPYTYTALQRFLDNTDGNALTQFRITAINGTVSSVRSTDSFTMSGFGLAFGKILGGQNA
jgi:hypothetical protein